MILTTDKTVVNNIGFEEESSFSINKEFLGKIFNVLSGFYGNVYESPLKEICNNAYDAELEAGRVPSPKIIYKDGVVSVSDKGGGMSKEFMLTKYTQAGFSTKSDNNVYIGAFGLGRMSLFAYLKEINESQYTVETIVNGIKYYYVVYKKDEIPCINLLHEEVTEEENGTTVSFSVPYYLKTTFESSIKNQLRFFDNIQIEGLNVNLAPFIKTKNYVVDFNNISYDTMKCVVGKNIYEINKGVEVRSSNILLYFDIGEVDLVENREQLKYTEKTLKAIREKYKIVKEEMQNLYNEQNKDVDSILKWYELKKSFNAYVNINGRDFNVSSFGISNSPSLKGYDESLLKHFHDFYNSICILFEKAEVRNVIYRNITLQKIVYTTNKEKFNTNLLKFNGKSLLINLDLNIHVDEYLKSLESHQGISINKEQFINFYEQLKEEIKEGSIHVSQLKKPIRYYTSNRLKADKGEIKYSILSKRTNKYIEEKVLIKDFLKNNCYIVFTELSELKSFYATHNVLYNPKRKFIYINKTDFKKLKNCKVYLFTDFINSKEYVNALVRGFIVENFEINGRLLNLSYNRYFSEGLKKVINAYKTFRKYKSYKNLTIYKGNHLIKENPLYIKFQEYIDEVNTVEKEITFAYQNHPFYKKYIILQKKLKRCQSK